MPDLLYNIERGFDDLISCTEVCVTYQYHKAQKGSRSSLYVPEEPDDEEYVEILSVTTKDGGEFSLTEEETQKIQKLCEETYVSNSSPY